MPLCAKQIELIIAAVIGAEINASVRFEVVGYEDQKPPYPRELVYIDQLLPRAGMRRAAVPQRGDLHQS